MIIKAGGQIFNSSDEPIIALFSTDELQRIAALSPGNDVLFSYPTYITREDAWKIAVKMRDEVAAARVQRDRLQVVAPPVSEPTLPTEVNKPEPVNNTPTPVSKEQNIPVPEKKTVTDDAILSMVGASKVEKNTEKHLTIVSDSDILAMVGDNNPTPKNAKAPKENTKAPKEENTKKSDAVLTASFDVASAEESVDGETRKQ